MNDFGRLVEAEIPRLRRYARALTRDAVRADDLVQSCLARAVAKQHLWQAGTDLRAWLFTILHNQHVNDVRRSVREGISVEVETAAPFLTMHLTQMPCLSCATSELLSISFRKSSGRPSCSWVLKACATMRLRQSSAYQLEQSARVCRAGAISCAS